MSHCKGDKWGESRKVREGELGSVIGAVDFPPKPIFLLGEGGQSFPAPLAGRSGPEADFQPMECGELLR